MTESSANLSVSWRSVTIGAVTVALTALTISAIVVTTKNADTLSVTALGLAVIAFIIQIIVFIVQASIATQQQIQAQEVYGSTVKALAAIEAKAEGTERTVTTINEKMLEAILGKALPITRSAGVSPDSPKFPAAVAENVARLAEVAEFENTPGLPRPVIKKEVSESGDGIFTKPVTLDEANLAIKVLEGLDGQALEDLYDLSQDYKNYINSPTRFTPGIEALTMAEDLYERGLIKRIVAEWNDRPIFVFTPLGLLAARTLLAKHVPREVELEVSQLRQRLTAELTRTAEILNEDLFPDIPVTEESE